MPGTRVIFFRSADGTAFVRDWLLDLRDRNARAFANCAARIRRLAELGYELRRPEADLLRDGIYELRAKQGRINYRILYFFHGRNAVVLTHALTKEKKVPNVEIQRAIARKKEFEANPALHTYQEEISVDDQ